MKIKWLYKIALPTIAIASIAPVVVSCSVEKPKPETQAEKEKRLEHQRAMEIAPNLTKFMKEYNNKLDSGESKYFIKSIKQLKEHTSNINHLNDFEKSYLGLYEDIENFFDNSIHRYTPNNLTFEYFENTNDDSDEKQYYPFLKLEENTLSKEQMFYHKIFQTMRQYNKTGLEGTTSEYVEGKEVLITEVLDKELTPIINEKIAEFAGNHKDFQFKNPKLTFKEAKTGTVIEVSVEVEYQNEKLPKELVIPLTFNVDIKTLTNNTVKLEKDIIKDQKEDKENLKLTMKKVKTFAEMENILKSKDNEYNRRKLKQVKEQYDATIKAVEDKEVEM